MRMATHVYTRVHEIKDVQGLQPHPHLLHVCMCVNDVCVSSQPPPPVKL